MACLSLPKHSNDKTLLMTLSFLCSVYLFQKVFQSHRITMRRRAGVGAIQRQKIQQDKFKEKGSEIQENQLEQVSEGDKKINRGKDKDISFDRYFSFTLCSALYYFH